jgi:hypothetical protein
LSFLSCLSTQYCRSSRTGLPIYLAPLDVVDVGIVVAVVAVVVAVDGVDGVDGVFDCGMVGDGVDVAVTVVDVDAVLAAALLVMGLLVLLLLVKALLRLSPGVIGESRSERRG